MATTRGIKLDDVTAGRLKVLAAKRERSPHWLMRKAIESYLEREERYEAEKAEDMAEYEDYQMTGKAIDNTAVLAWLDGLANNKNTPRPQ
jgi:predicted transcriptional regulator